MYSREDLFIGGEWRKPSSQSRIEVISPSSEEVIGTAIDANGADVEAATAAARRAFDGGPWARMAVEERADVIEQALKSLEARTEELANLVTAEMGAPIAISEQVIPASLDLGRYFINVARSEPLVDVRRGSTNTSAVIREPVGVVGSISPWNGPFFFAVGKICPALVTGCSVVYKPAPETPFDVYYLIEALAEAGVPDGVINLVTGGRETGMQLVESSEVNKISFTGSTDAGRKIGEACGRDIKRMQLELGGKSAAIILDDADLQTAMAAIAYGGYFNSGQICSALSRIIAPRSRHDEIVEALVATAESFVVGDPFDRETTQGPLITSRQRDRVEALIASGQDEGARVATGGRRPDLQRGWFVEPTVMVDATTDMRIAQEEIFGPVVTLIDHDGVEDAIRIANDSKYGLHGAVFTGDDEVALQVARRIRTGTFSCNDFVYNIEAPFGGVKGSGVGRDTGLEGLLSYYETKTVNITPSMERLFAGK